MTEANSVGRAENHPGCYQTESEQQGLTQGDRGNLRTPTVLPFGREDPSAVTNCISRLNRSWKVSEPLLSPSDLPPKEKQAHEENHNRKLCKVSTTA